ncbi:DMT family transporter [Pseudomonas gingeri]|uniref:DMT family transporter n=1 Tax=Pseudomonas gingeri TaxID=117681 RepID=A0A7Y8CIK6_9PSED|nr:DMT family transporter [Pseudomonas gingeri]NWA00702.1 DMT family transporter [Pseudomonas gingeri]NWA16254.1 DMT family transporter [Pseudomonas gingeri]NWA54444.1 DMT family transporter [Pseudomonas gingeri]NWA97479.1 DMT family transporter [Pseudomonas gingeri]NWB04285.1 DMT family transporter [Pseudomonas gingeri]
MSTLNWLGLLALAAIAGAVVPFQSAVNANLGRGLGHPLWATLVSLLVSMTVLLPTMLALRLPFPDLEFAAKAPAWVWLGGLFGVCFVALAVLLVPRLGAGGFIALALAGQVSASLLLDHFGLFGLHARPLDTPRLIGAALLIAGVVTIQFSNAPGQPVASPQPSATNGVHSA